MTEIRLYYRNKERIIEYDADLLRADREYLTELIRAVDYIREDLIALKETIE